MSDPVSQNWFLASIGAIGSTYLAIFEYFRRKVERLESEQKNFITLDQLAAIELRLEARALAAEGRAGTMHSDNTNNFREMRLQLESVNTKLFELAKK